MAEPAVIGEADTPEAQEAHRAFAMGAPVNPEPPKEPEADAPEGEGGDAPKEDQTPDPANAGDDQKPPAVPEP